MANINIEMYSNCLRRQVSLKMVVPSDYRLDAFNQNGHEVKERGRMKTLFMLHGYTGMGECWLPYDLIEKYNLAVICPNGENGFWLNGMTTGSDYQSFIGEELIGFLRRTFNLALDRDETYILGFSMGGFGALHTALAYPETFGKTIALSSALVHYEVLNMKPGDNNGVANYEYYRACFGEPSELINSDNMPENLVKKILSSDGKLPMPEIFMACGTEDFLLEPNRKMHGFLEESGVSHRYEEWKGIHDLNFCLEAVNKYFPIAMEN